MIIKTYETRDGDYCSEDIVGKVYVFVCRRYRLLSVERQPTKTAGQVLTLRTYGDI